MRSCPLCRSKTRVLETRDTRQATRRRRECRECGHRYTTWELELIGVVERHEKAAATEAEESAAAAANATAKMAEQVGDKLDWLPQDIVDTIVAEAEWRQGRELGSGEAPALPPGDD